QTKIEDLHPTFARNQNVSGLEVTMNDAGCVRSRQSVCNLNGHVQQFADVLEGCEWRAVDVLHHEIIRPDVKKRAYVGMIECGNRARFTFETPGELLRRTFDRHDAIDSRIA